WLLWLRRLLSGLLLRASRTGLGGLLWLLWLRRPWRSRGTNRREKAAGHLRIDALIKLRHDVGDRGRIRKLQGDNHHVNFGAGAKALDVLDELDDFVDVRRVLPLDHDDAQFLERLAGDRTARPDGRRRPRRGRRGWLPGRHLFVAYELERIRRLNPISLLRIEEDGKL